MQKWRERYLKHLLFEWHHCRQRGRVCLTKKKKKQDLEAFSCSIYPSAEVPSVCKMVKLTICCSGWRMCMQNVLFQSGISSPLTYLWILTSFTWWMVPLPFTSILQNMVSGQKLDGGKVWNEAKPKKLSVNFSHFAQIYDSNYMLTENCLQCKKWNPYNFYISKLLSLCQQGEKKDPPWPFYSKTQQLLSLWIHP